MKSIENKFTGDDDDDIDLIDIISILWKNKKTIIITTIITISIATVTSFLLTKEYLSFTTFHIQQSESPNANLMGYASALGINKNSNIENIVESLLRSDRIKVKVAKIYINLYEDTIKNLITKKKLINSEEHITDFVIKELKLHKKINYSKSKEGLIKLSYSSPSANLSKKILLSYLNTLKDLNKELEISAEKKFLTVIDYPQEALRAHKPNLKVNILIGIFVGILVL